MTERRRSRFSYVDDDELSFRPGVPLGGKKKPLGGRPPTPITPEAKEARLAVEEAAAPAAPSGVEESPEKGTT